jgi:hypothetical protein
MVKVDSFLHDSAKFREDLLFVRAMATPIE